MAAQLEWNTRVYVQSSASYSGGCSGVALRLKTRRIHVHYIADSYLDSTRWV
ncbi:hypothetical protein HMPREF0733_11471 [Rothia dentocariosa ATCC 17931]|uniref:Uncharacterized protein n=1 Tax=Rothia dentocariosa (strain ATCC 17931 / CDC X599 / XDIA) TaxID=762948 RepID=E3GZV8_ROTDC|nr:hypothetical protein HMPREF0733_11471 [Rothia dentocariosa ATCC 17931]